MDNFYFESCQHGVNFSVEARGIDLRSLFLNCGYNCFVPSLKIATYVLNGAPFVNYVDSESAELDLEDPTNWKIKFPWRQMRSGETLMYLAYALIERSHQQARMLTAHAASVCRSGDDGILLLGKEGSGKSLTALKLCRDHGFQLGANDLAVLAFDYHKVFVETGTDFFFLRKESVQRNLPELVPDIFRGDATRDAWLHKVKVRPEDLGVSFFFNERRHPIKVSRAYLVHIDETKDELVVSQPPALTTTLYLNENFSRYIRNTCTTLLGGADYQMLGYIPSLDEPRFYQFRAKIIDYLIKIANLRYISGPLDKVAEFIARN